MKFFFTIFIIALILRILVLFLGYHGDLNNQISWGTLAVERGLINFYEGTNWPNSAPNQPPLTILLLAAMAGLWNIIHQFSWYLNDALSFFPSSFIWFWEAKGMILLMKLPGILADLGIGYLIYSYFNRSKNKELQRQAFLLSIVWLFNPIVWYNSSIWGQTDSIVNLLGLLSVFSLLSKNLRWSVFWFTLCLLFKGSLSYFIPILFVIAIFQNYSFREWFLAIAYCLVPIVLLSVLFHPQFDLPLWLYNLYTQVFIPGEIGYLTANAFNFWWLIDSGKTYDSILYFGIPARILGFIIPGMVILWQIIEFRKEITDKKVFFALAIIAFTIFVFMTRIHERYLYPFFPYATLLLGFIPVLWFVYIPLSLIHLLNLYNLFWVPPIPVLENALKNTSFSYILSLVTVILWICLLSLPSIRKKLYNR